MGRPRQRPEADAHNPTPRFAQRTSEPGTLPDWASLGVDTDARGFDPDWWSTPPKRAATSARASRLGRRWQFSAGRFWSAGADGRAKFVGLPTIAVSGVLVGAILLSLLGILLVTGRPTSRSSQEIPPSTESVRQSAAVPEGTAGPPEGGGAGGTSAMPARAEPTILPTRGVAGPPAPRVAERVADEAVLYWLPEIIDASDATGVPASLIAAVIRVESQGNPDAVSPAGARGLMQLMPSHLEEQGIDPGLWHDPKTNIQAGALLLKWKIESTGNQWDGVRFYFGIKCDAFTCTEEYVDRVYRWRTHYAPIIAEG